MKCHILSFSRQHTWVTWVSYIVISIILMSDDEPSLSFTAMYDDGVQTEGITLLIWVKEISSGSQGISSRSATCSTAFPKFNFVKGTIHHTLAAAAGTACFHRKAAFCVITDYRRIFSLTFTCFYACVWHCPSSEIIIMSHHEETICV